MKMSEMDTLQINISKKYHQSSSVILWAKLSADSNDTLFKIIYGKDII